MNSTSAEPLLPPVVPAVASTPPARRDRRLRFGWTAVVLVCVVTIFGQLDRGIMALLVQSIKHDTGYTDTEISLLMGLAYSAVYMLAGLPMARVADVGRRSLMLPGALVVWSLGTVFCGLSQNFVQFFVSRGVVAAGEAVKGPTTTSLITDLVPRDKVTRGMGLYNLAVSLGESGALVIGGLLIGWVATLPVYHLPLVGELHSWRMVYLIFGIPGILFALVFLATVGEPERRGRRYARAAPLKDVAAFFCRGTEARVALPAFVSASMSSIYLLGAMAWRPAFYERTFHLSPQQFGPIVGSAAFFTAPVGIIVGTWLYERMVRKYDDANMRLVFWIDLITIPIAIAGPLMPTFWTALGCSLTASLLLMIAAPARTSVMQLISPNEMRAQVNAVMMFTVGVIGGFGPTVVALVTDHVFHDDGMLRWSMALVAAVGAPTMALMSWIARKPFAELNRKAKAEAKAEEAELLAQLANERDDGD